CAAPLPARPRAAAPGGLSCDRGPRRLRRGRDGPAVQPLRNTVLLGDSAGGLRGSAPRGDGLPLGTGGSAQRRLLRAASASFGTAARATGAPSERGSRQPLPLLRPAGATTAARRLLDARAEARGYAGPAARAPELRRLAAGCGEAPATPRCSLPRRPWWSLLAGRRLVRVSRPDRSRLGQARARRRDRHARPRPARYAAAGAG